MSKLKFEVHVDNINIESFYVSTYDGRYDDIYASINIVLKSGDNKLSKVELKTDDISKELKRKIDDFLREIEEDLELDIMRKAKQLPPHIDNEIETVDGEVS